MKILYVTPYIPSRIYTRPYNLIRALARQGHEITVLTASGTAPEASAEVAELKAQGLRVEAFPVPTKHSLMNCLTALPTRTPLQAVYAHHPAMEARLRALLATEPFDVVHIEHLRASRLVRAVQGVPVVYDSVDCIALLFEKTLRTSPQWRSRLMAALDLRRTRRYEAHLMTKYDQVLVTSVRDKEALEDLTRRYLPPDVTVTPITVVTNGVDLEYFRPLDQPRVEKTVIFSGKMSYHANVAAVLYFAQEILPHIWAKDDTVRFQVVGKDPKPVIQQLAADPRIEVTGYVDDLRPYLGRATLSVCPIRYAVGIQNKLLEAMAMRTPVVCTPIAAAGLTDDHQDVVLVADTPEAFAASVLRVIADRELATRLSNHGRNYVEMYHSWDASARKLVSLYERACRE